VAPVIFRQTHKYVRPFRPSVSIALPSPDPSSDRSPSTASSAKHSGSKKLSAIATAIGLKSKKPPLAMQEPPSPFLSPHSPAADDVLVVPPSPAPSISSRAGAWEDAPESETPSGPSKDYPQSLLTLSDSDPSSPCSSSVNDPARLYIFDESSATDSHPRAFDSSSSYNRISYASSSSFSLSTPSPMSTPSFRGWRLSRYAPLISILSAPRSPLLW